MRRESQQRLLPLPPLQTPPTSATKRHVALRRDSNGPADTGLCTVHGSFPLERSGVLSPRTCICALNIMFRYVRAFSTMTRIGNRGLARGWHQSRGVQFEGVSKSNSVKLVGTE
jgi:hypothetical protein